MENGDISLSVDLFECNICQNVPKNDHKLCENGHMVCNTCWLKITNCPVCRGEIGNLRLNIIDKIIEAVIEKQNKASKESNEKDDRSKSASRKRSRSDQDDLDQEPKECVYAKSGCDQILTPKEKQNHEPYCQFRQISCFHQDCQPSKTQFQLKFIQQHFMKLHPDFGDVGNQSIVSNVLTGNGDTECFEASISGITLVFLDSKLLWIFYGSLSVTGFSETTNKACLISLAPKDQVEKYECSITFDFGRKNKLEPVGDVFSIDDMENIHRMDSGGLIYSKDMIKAFENRSLKAKVQVHKRGKVIEEILESEIQTVVDVDDSVLDVIEIS